MSHKMILLGTYSSKKETEVPRDMRPQNRNSISSDTDFGSRAIIECWNMDICSLMVLNFATGEEPLKKIYPTSSCLASLVCLALEFQSNFHPSWH